MKFTVNSTRFDPYKSFKFRIIFGGRYVAGLSKMSPLKRTTEVVKHRSGGDPSSGHKSPGRSKYEAITFSRGVTHDSDFDAWASGATRSAEAMHEPSREDITLEIYDEAGRLEIAYNVLRCWVSEYQSAPELDGTANAIAIELIRIENEGLDPPA
jgi:phage tail-like protein